MGMVRSCAFADLSGLLDEESECSSRSSSNASSSSAGSWDGPVLACGLPPRSRRPKRRATSGCKYTADPLPAAFFSKALGRCPPIAQHNLSSTPLETSAFDFYIPDGGSETESMSSSETDSSSCSSAGGAAHAYGFSFTPARCRDATDKLDGASSREVPLRRGDISKLCELLAEC
eukprot:TRINITY_DN13845_c0_g1_i1.p1 TRINITY_DN13845_c0_g1~~TRINITY_DN13845_c0_g1_i1.p1  ORF type:complete len:198 (-),score=59.51 TRINITY_DN13845_c0_g1_i1:249-773(-)